MKQEIRIIGGMYRSKKLYVPDVEGLRPTPDRVRETLFNWLMHSIKGARCLDAFAGSGALGFEAFSRGAAEVTLIEQVPKAHDHLNQVIRSWNSPALKLLKTDALSYLQTSKDQFDIIFLDPPFALNYLNQCVDLVAKKNILPQGGLLYTESATIIHMDEQHWREIKFKKAGQVLYGLFEKL